MKIPPLKAIVVFEAIARLGSVTRAAEEVGLSPSAASHQLANLESITRQPLFIREGRGLSLTPAGERYLSDISGLLADLSRATERISNADTVDVLRVHANPSFGFLWLLDRLPSFQALHPEIEVNLACSFENISFANGQCDVDIRYGQANWPALEVRTIAHEHYLPLASPDYLARHPVTDAQALMLQSLILTDTALLQWPQWFARQQIPFTGKRFRFRFDRSYMTLNAAANGMGIALESSLFAAAHLARGELVPVLPLQAGIAVDAHHVVHPAQSRFVPRVSRFVDWLFEQRRMEVANAAGAGANAGVDPGVSAGAGAALKTSSGA